MGANRICTKIIAVDNFDRELIGASDDRLIAENVDVRYVDDIVKALNDDRRRSAEIFFKAVPNDYALKEYRP